MLEAPFSLGKMRRDINKIGLTSPGKDEVCYVMLAHLSDDAMEALLGLYHKVWQEGEATR